MASSVFERTRALHADVETMHEALLDKINTHTTSTADRILLDHELRHLVDELTACQANLRDLYADPDGVRTSELAALSGAGDALWTTFYDTLSSIRQYHAKYPNAARALTAVTKANGEDSVAALVDAEAIEDGVGGTTGKIHFTTEEYFGGRVDMNELYERYINLPQHARTTDYITFLQTFHNFASVPREKKIKAHREEYRKYLRAVLSYLLDFHQRIRPLVDTDELRRMIADDFAQRWQAKAVPGWFESDVTAAAAATPAPEAANGAAAVPAASAATNGATSATAADASNPLYCAACAKLFAKQTVFDAHLPGKKHKKNAEILAALGATPSNTATAAAPANSNAAGTDATATATAATATLALKLAEEIRSLALLEDEIHQFALLLSDEITATLEYLQKKQTRTYEEIAAEIAAQEELIAQAKQHVKSGIPEEEEEQEEETDTHGPIYNPLNLPLGFDGKPIPYWLWKVNQMHLKFDCEICGNFTYNGPREFERHFTEWRHAYGMRALGIPNTKHFAHITKIDAARALFEKLKKEGVGAGWRPDDEEEFEDSDGNVFNKKAYIELQRQGLI